ncbi:MAG: hypothetical protein AAFR90_01825 [Pseudomonadota bacterium]
MIGITTVNLVEEFENGRPFASYNTGERLSIALILDRMDLIKQAGYTYQEAIETVGAEGMIIVKSIIDMRRNKNRNSQITQQMELFKQLEEIS